MDPPSHQTNPGIADAQNSATGGSVNHGGTFVGGNENEEEEGVWRPPLGGMKRDVIGRVIEMVTREGGVGEEVLAGLEGVDVE